MSNLALELPGRHGGDTRVAGDFAQRVVAWLDAHPHAERVLIAVTVGTLWTGGYHLIGWGTDPLRATSLATPLDLAIPFVPETVYLYGLVYGAALYPIFAVRSRGLLRRTALAYALVIAASFACFAAFPVTCVDLRPPLATLDGETLHGWSVRLLYALDPPTNLFPSLHVGLAGIGAASAWRASRGHGLVAATILGATLVSICTVKQHYVADGVAALLLVAVVDRAVLSSFRAAPGDGPAAYPWSGAARCAALQTGLYAVLAVAFLAGVRV